MKIIAKDLEEFKEIHQSMEQVPSKVKDCIESVEYCKPTGLMIKMKWAPVSSGSRITYGEYVSMGVYIPEKGEGMDVTVSTRVGDSIWIWKIDYPLVCSIHHENIRPAIQSAGQV